MSSNLADKPSSANGPQYQSRDDLAEEPSSADGPPCLADKPSSADGPPPTSESSTWQTNLLLMDPPADKPSSANGAHLLARLVLGRQTFFGQWTPQYQSRDTLNTSTQNLADDPTLANGPPQCQSTDALHTSTHNLADEATLADGPPLPEQRCLEYQYTILGRWTYFGQWTPKYQSIDALNTSTQNLADESTLANGPPLHWYQSRDALNTSTQNLANEPTLANGCPTTLVPEQRCLEYQYTKLGRWTYFGWWTPPVPEQRCLEYQYTILGRWTYFGQWTPQYQSIDALNTSTQNLADEPTLANGPPLHWYQSRDDLNTSTQNLANEPTLANGCPTTLAPEQRCLEYQYTKLGRWTYFGWWTPPVPEQRCLEYQYTILGRWTYFGQWTPQGNSRDAFTLLLTSSFQEWQFHFATYI